MLSSSNAHNISTPCFHAAFINAPDDRECSRRRSNAAVATTHIHANHPVVQAQRVTCLRDCQLHRTVEGSRRPASRARLIVAREARRSSLLAPRAHQSHSAGSSTVRPLLAPVGSTCTPGSCAPGLTRSAPRKCTPKMAEIGQAPGRVRLKDGP